jgi:hypothetical protein
MEQLQGRWSCILGTRVVPSGALFRSQAPKAEAWLSFVGWRPAESVRPAKFWPVISLFCCQRKRKVERSASAESGTQVATCTQHPLSNSAYYFVAYSQRVRSLKFCGTWQIPCWPMSTIGQTRPDLSLPIQADIQRLTLVQPFLQQCIKVLLRESCSSLGLASSSRSFTITLLSWALRSTVNPHFLHADSFTLRGKSSAKFCMCRVSNRADTEQVDFRSKRT